VVERLPPQEELRVDVIGFDQPPHRFVIVAGSSTASTRLKYDVAALAVGR
jgi:hypothetical protein